MGGGSSSPPPSQANVQAERLAKIQGDIGQQLFDQSSPLRELLTSQSLEQLGGVGALREQIQSPLAFNPIDPVTVESITANPAFAAQKSFTEQQFQGARDATIGNTARGGVLSDLLGDLELGRARENTQQFGQLAQQEVARLERERAGGLQVDSANKSTLERDLDRILGGAGLGGFGQTGQGISALSSGSNTLASLGANQAAIAQANANRDAGKSGGAGQAIGTIGGAVVGGYFGGPAGASLGATAGGAVGGSVGGGGGGGGK